MLFLVVLERKIRARGLGYKWLYENSGGVAFNKLITAVQMVYERQWWWVFFVSVFISPFASASLEKVIPGVVVRLHHWWLVLSEIWWQNGFGFVAIASRFSFLAEREREF